MAARSGDVLLTFSKNIPRTLLNQLTNLQQPFILQLRTTPSFAKRYASSSASAAHRGLAFPPLHPPHHLRSTLLRSPSTIHGLNARSFMSRSAVWDKATGGKGDGNGKWGDEGIALKDDTDKTPGNNEQSDGQATAPADGENGAVASGGAGGASDGGGGDGKGENDDFVEKIITQNPEGSTTEINTSALETISVPKEYPQLLAIPLNRRPLFPGFYKSLYIKDPQAIAAIQELMNRRQPYVGIFLSKNDDLADDVVTDVSQIHRVGVFAQVTNVYQAGPDNSALTVVLYPHRRIRLNKLVGPPPAKATPVVATITEGENKDAKEQDESAKEKPELSDEETAEYLPINKHLANYHVSLADVENMPDEPFNPNNNIVRAVTQEMLNALKEISNLSPLIRDQIITFSIQTGGNAFADPAKLADFAAAISSGEPSQLQGVLESLVIEERLQKALIVVKNELANAKLQQEIAKEVDKKITRRQQEYFLMEQLKGIKKELGIDTDGKDKLIEKFKERAVKLNMPEAVKKVFDEELTKLQHLEAAASEFNVTRNYLDWLTQIPWGQYSKENFDIKHAATVLDEDHYGLNDVKDRILEFIAVGKLRGTVEGKIICLQGPPGVGKTSIGKSIARALGREFFRFSVGGLTDVAEIKGHRRTYVGAMPGKVVQALKKVQTENPLIMIDEIDKLGRGHQGDPASALLELLDPEQNNSFLDHYMDVPLDLSKVLFVCTANMLETIPAPLLDRMEIIRLSGYVAEEKVAIASKYLAPSAREAAGLTDADVKVEDSAIEHLIRFYCRESGVRNLKKHIDKIYRKAAFKIVKGDSDGAAIGKPLDVKPENLKEYVGSPVFTSDRMYDHTPPGVVMGLAWTSMGMGTQQLRWTSIGGSSLYIESVLESAISDGGGKPSFHRTGQMGDVMKESTTIAYTYARALMTKKFPDNKLFDKAHIHLHVPEGATPKDGPSAGSTMVTSLLSLGLNRSVIPDVAMTGEITLTGKILKIGGVKEKTIAAKRSGVKNIIFPAANRADWDELADYIKEGLEPHFVSWYEEIFDVVFPAEK
ncbi:Lon protease C-terminal proteolytic domain-containing protein [Phlyctochytrium arcticum]|nr:Lon protease C-terminal proteolytic domain-containing protein [Phlyctochytrium arcticum]